MPGSSSSIAIVSPRASVARRVPLRLVTLTMLAGCLANLAGCASLGSLWHRNSRDQLTTVRPRFSDDPQLEEVVDHLNRNVGKLESWRAHNVQIRANNLPLHGTLAVEKGGHLRLQVNTVVSHEVDMGSNDDVFWIWAKRMEPAYVYCRHDQIDAARQTLGVPFEPQWLMQALGVAPLETQGLTMQIDATAHRARLVQPVVTAHGHALKKVMLVDLVNGVIVEHSVFDERGQKVARARLEDFRVDRDSGAILPRRVMLDWPQNQMSLVMNLGTVEVNPPAIPSQIWEMPRMPGVQMVDLGKEARPGTRIADSQRTRIADSGSEPIVRLLEPEDAEEDTGEDGNAGRVRLSGDEILDEPEAPIQRTKSIEQTESIEFQTAPIERPAKKSGKNWWD